MTSASASHDRQRLLLVSSSKTHDSGFLVHCAAAIQKHFAGVDRVLFVPYALADRDRYAELVASRFAELGLGLDSLHTAADPAAAVRNCSGVFVGGGNTFRLLKTLYDLEILDLLRQRVLQGVPYMGSSAGTNMACPTIRTTNDMPIVQPPSFAALNLVPFQINPHFLDADPTSMHQGETRETRLREYLEENDVPVAAIREGSWLQVHGTSCRLEGKAGMVLFRRGQEPAGYEPGASLDFLLGAGG